MEEEVKRMRKDRLKRTRHFRGSVMMHQESIQESVNRSKKRQEQRDCFINERRFPAQGLIQPTFNTRNINWRQQWAEHRGYRINDERRQKFLSG